MTYRVDDYHKIEVAETQNGFEVRFFERFCNAKGETVKWCEVGQPEIWGKMEDVKWEYGIE